VAAFYKVGGGRLRLQDAVISNDSARSVHGFLGYFITVTPSRGLRQWQVAARRLLLFDCMPVDRRATLARILRGTQYRQPTISMIVNALSIGASRKECSPLSRLGVGLPLSPSRRPPAADHHGLPNFDRKISIFWKTAIAKKLCPSIGQGSNH
jgi:hypothetical protein